MFRLSSDVNELPCGRSRQQSSSTQGDGVLVPVIDVGLDVSNQRSHGVERAAADGLSREDAEPGFDHIEPGGSGRGEVKVHPWMSFQPRLDLRGLVCR